MMLATLFPLYTLTLLGDAPVASALPAQTIFTPEVVIALGLLLAKALVDALASAFNQHLRSLKAQGVKASPAKLFFGSVLNFFALNLDQTARQAKAAKRSDTPPA